MKRRILSLCLALGCVLAVLAVVATNRPTPTVHAAGGGACPASFMLGFYGFSATDFVYRGNTAFPAATGGQLSFFPDPAPEVMTGTISGRVTTNTGLAPVTRLSLKGTYRMSGFDCSGRAVLTESTGVVRHYDLWPTEWINGGHAEDVLMVRTDAHIVESLDVMSM